MASFRDAGHLPKRRPSGPPADPEGLPRQRRGVTPQMHGRYPDYDVLAEMEHWDEETRRVVLDRVERVPEIHFFSEAEAATLGAFCDAVTGQDREPRIPVLRFVDAKLYERRLDGYRYAELPDDADTWRLVARGLDEAARERGAESFAAAPTRLRLEVCAAFHRGELSGGAWEEAPAGLAWKVVMRAVLEAFYAHPWAWNEIGFGGPAYPRGYARMGVGLSEAWEGEEAFELDPVRDVAERGIDL